MDLETLNETAVSTAKALHVDDAIALSSHGKDRMIRFANNSATVVKNVEETELTVYLGKDKRRTIASTSNVEAASVKKFVKDLFASLKGLPKSDYVFLPKKARKFKSASQGRMVHEAGDQLPDLAKSAIGASIDAGGKRSAGVILVSDLRNSILSTTGTSGSDSKSSITLNIRSFGDNDASGHGLSCSSTLSGFDPEEAGRRAGNYSKSMTTASEPEPGSYQVLLSPTVASNLLETVAGAASAFSVDAGLSYLSDKIGKRVASKTLELTDHGQIKGGLDGRSFDDEGTPTRSTKIVENGVLRGYLHNLTTAKKWKTESTGNAGFIDPRSWNLEVGAGDATYDEMVKEMRRGIILTSNWYTRFKNYRTGEFSTVPRDGAYMVENGKVVKSLKGMRMSDDLQRMFSSVSLLSKNREWIQWWEVDTPTLCPWILVDGTKITRAYE